MATRLRPSRDTTHLEQQLSNHSPSRLRAVRSTDIFYRAFLPADVRLLRLSFAFYSFVVTSSVLEMRGGGKFWYCLFAIAAGYLSFLQQVPSPAVVTQRRPAAISSDLGKISIYRYHFAFHFRIKPPPFRMRHYVEG